MQVVVVEVVVVEVAASKQQQPLSKARPEFKSPAQFLLLPLDGVRRCPNFKTPVASLHERWCVFFPYNHSKIKLISLFSSIFLDSERILDDFQRTLSRNH